MEALRPKITGDAMRWMKTGSLRFARHGHQLAVLPDGRVLCFGGLKDYQTPVARMEVWDPRTGRWTAAEGVTIPRYEKVAPPDFGYSRTHAAAAPLKDGKLLVSGGVSETSSWDGEDEEDLVPEAVICDPAEPGLAVPAGSLLQPRRDHAAAALGDDRVLVCGGTTEYGRQTLASAEVWVPGDDTASAILAGRGGLAFEKGLWAGAREHFMKAGEAGPLPPGAMFMLALSEWKLSGTAGTESAMLHAAAAMLRDARMEPHRKLELARRLEGEAGNEILEAALKLYCSEEIGAAVNAPANRKKTVLRTMYRLREEMIHYTRGQDPAGPGCDALLGEAAAAFTSQSAAVAEYLAYQALKSGRGDDAKDALEDLAARPKPTVSSLNNLAGELLRKNDLDGADRVLDRVEKIISRRAAPKNPEKRLEFLLDEYFFQANRSNALWARGAFGKGMAHARKAFALEKALRERTRGIDALIGGLGYRAEHVYSTGSWALISMLTGLKGTREAQGVFEALLEEDAVMEARFSAHRENAEMMLVAGICAYTAPREQKRLAPGGRLWKLMTRHCPAPSTPHLAYAYACLHAVSGKGDEALSLLGKALKLGFSKQHAREDPDLASLRGNQKFRRLTGYGEP